MNQHRRSRLARLRWLREHPEAWQSFPPTRGRVELPRVVRRGQGGRAAGDDDPLHLRPRWDLIVAAMKRDGVVSPHTWSGDVRVEMLIEFLRWREQKGARHATQS